jgi:PAS domain S-box-containing protein
MSDNPVESNAPKQSQLRTSEQVQALIRSCNDLIELMRTQRDVLRQKGMNLPPGSLDQLKMIKTRLEALQRQLTGTQIELRQLRALADTTALINSTLDPDEVLEQVMDTVIKLTGAERGYLLLRNPDSNEIDNFAVARGIDQEEVGQGDLTVSKTVVRQVAESGEPILTDNAQEDARLKEGASIANLKLLSILAVPLKVRDNVIGVVYVDNRVMKGLFTKSDVNMLAAFANQAGVAIENARLFESARTNLAQVTEFRDLMNSIFTSITSGVITVDNREIVITSNAAAERILNTGGSIVGKPLKEIMPDVGAEFFDKLKQVRSNGSKELIEAKPVLNGQGERFWNLIASPLRDGNGRSQGVTIVLDDLTEQKQREAQLAEVRRYLPPQLVEHIRSVEEINIEGEEREITAIFCDVRGFTTFSERLQPEELMRIINKYLSVASDGINLYEGIVDKYMGDAVTGLFNTQLNPQENHAERAVRAAQSIIYDLLALHEILPEEQRLFYGIGVHTGKAVLGNVGSPERKEFAALGNATDISKVLQENAGRGEIIVSQSTYEYIKDQYECEERVPEKTKGANIKVVYKVGKRKKGAHTGQLFLDPEFADLLND